MTLSLLDNSINMNLDLSELTGRHFSWAKVKSWCCNIIMSYWRFESKRLGCYEKWDLYLGLHMENNSVMQVCEAHTTRTALSLPWYQVIYRRFTRCIVCSGSSIPLFISSEAMNSIWCTCNRVTKSDNDMFSLRQQLIQYTRDMIISGHSETPKTLHVLHKQLFWPSMYLDAASYGQSCVTCQIHKPSNSKPRDQPLQIAWRPWSTISMDYITKLSVYD